jgi:hypothetical protein
LDLAVALPAELATTPCDRSAGDRLTLAAWRLVSAVEIPVTRSLAKRASKNFT